MRTKLVNVKEYAQKREHSISIARKTLSVGSFLGPYTVSFLMFFVFSVGFRHRDVVFKVFFKVLSARRIWHVRQFQSFVWRYCDSQRFLVVRLDNR